MNGFATFAYLAAALHTLPHQSIIEKTAATLRAIDLSQPIRV